MDASFKLYKDILKYDKVLLDETERLKIGLACPETKPTAASSSCRPTLAQAASPP